MKVKVLILLYLDFNDIMFHTVTLGVCDLNSIDLYAFHPYYAYKLIFVSLL